MLKDGNFQREAGPRMDVRCEKCGTEYELDEAKVTEPGVQRRAQPARGQPDQPRLLRRRSGPRTHADSCAPAARVAAGDHAAARAGSRWGEYPGGRLDGAQ